MASGRYVVDQRRAHRTRPRRARLHPLPRPAVRGAARDRRHRARRRCPSDRRPVAADVAVRRIVTLVGGARAPQQYARAADGRARPRARRRCPRRRDRPPALPSPVGDRRGGDRTGRGEPARGVERRIRRSRHFARPGSARGVDGGRGRARLAASRLSCHAAAGRRVRCVPMGIHRRPPTPRAHRATFRQPGPAATRQPAGNGSAVRARRSFPDRDRRAGRRSLRSPGCSAPTRSGRRTTSGTTASAAHVPSSRRRCSTSRRGGRPRRTGHVR